MNDPNFAPLVLGVLSVLVSIAAFVLGDSEKNKSWRIALGITFLFLAILLGAYGVVVLMLPGDQGQVAQPRASENPPTAAKTSAITDMSTTVTEHGQENPQAGIQPTPTSTPILHASLAQELTATDMPTPTAAETSAPTPPQLATFPIDLPGCGAPLNSGETQIVGPGIFIVGDIIIDGKRQFDSREKEGTVAYFERPATVTANWGAGCYVGDIHMLDEVVQRDFQGGCDTDCTKVRVVYVRADGQQEEICWYPDNTSQPLQRSNEETWCP